ncbi:MAG: hypothetical protein WD316_00035 [Phycisphaeraceae bacterium]
MTRTLIRPILLQPLLRRMGASVPVVLLVLLASSPAEAQFKCFHQGQPVICPAGITPGSTSVNFTPMGILWSDGNTSIGFNPQPFPNNGGGGSSAGGNGFASIQEQALYTTELNMMHPLVIATAFHVYRSQIASLILMSGSAGEMYMPLMRVLYIRQMQLLWQWQMHVMWLSMQHRYMDQSGQAAQDGEPQQAAPGPVVSDTVTVDESLIDGLIGEHLPGEAGDRAREVLDQLKQAPTPTFVDSSVATTTPGYDDSISYLESQARFRERMAEREQSSARGYRRNAQQQRDFAERYRELATTAREYAEQASNEEDRRGWEERAEEHEAKASDLDDYADREEQRAADSDARAQDESRQAQDARDLEEQQKREAQARYERYLETEAANEAAIQQRLADLAAADEAARLAALPQPGTRENPIQIDTSDPNGAWAREVARMEQEIQDRADGDIYAGFYDPRIPAALDSEYLSRQDQYFEFNGRVMNGGELNYYFQGMYWAKAGLPEVGMDALIYGWKALKWATDENYTKLTPSANDIAAAEAGHDDFW